MQPVQLSLLPEEYPAPPAILIAQLPETSVAAAVTLLAALIAGAARGPARPAHQEAGDE